MGQSCFQRERQKGYYAITGYRPILSIAGAGYVDTVDHPKNRLPNGLSIPKRTEL